MQPSLKDRQEADEKYSPAAVLAAKEQAALDQIEEGLKRVDANDPSQDAVKNQEELPSFETDLSKRPKSNIKKLAGVMKNPRSIVSMVGGGGAAILILIMITVLPASILQNVAGNLTLKNDSSSTALERRSMKALNQALKPKDDICKAGKGIKCNKMGRVSNSALKKMGEKGFVAMDGEKPMKLEGRYPKTNPKTFQVAVPDGTKTKLITVEAKELTSFLSKTENRALAKKILGTGGLLNLRTKAWFGKHISQSFYKKFNLLRNGGIASKTMKSLKSSERIKKIRSKLPSSEKINSVAEGVRGKVEGKLNKAAKGGVGYMAAVAGCVAIKAPGFIAGGVAAVQLAQTLPMVMDFVLSPNDKEKAAGFDSGFTEEDKEAAATALTEPTPRKSDGKMTSAVDSMYLLAAMGIGGGKMPLSSKFTPGLALLTNPGVRAADKVDDALAPACNRIMSPVALYSAIAVDSAITVAASATVIGGVIKVAASFAITQIASAVAGKLIGEAAKVALKELAENKLIPEAVGEDLGDVIGISAAAFFSAGAMSRLVPTLPVGKLAAYNEVQLENERFNREMDIASLSPFDTSSQYTFLGSILHNSQVAMLKNGAYSNSFSSIISNLARLPMVALASGNNTTHAAVGLNAEYCSYAEDFGLETRNADGSIDVNTTPAINMSGLPCTGILPEQAGMSTEDAIDYMLKEGWLDENIEPGDDDTIADLISKNYIVPNTPLRDFVEDCGDASTGDYIFGATGCMINPPGGDPDQVTDRLNVKCVDVEGGESGTTKTCYSDAEEFQNAPDLPAVINANSLMAMSVFLLDYQVMSMFNDEDKEVEAPTTSEALEPSGEAVIDAASKDGWIWPLQNQIRRGPCYKPGHVGMDMNSSIVQDVYAAHDGEVVWAKNYGDGGNAVRIKTPEGIYYTYQHLTSYSVRAGQSVKAGQVVGVGGLTGHLSVSSATKVHLHMVVSRANDDPSRKPGKAGQSFDPMQLLPTPAPNGYKCG